MPQFELRAVAETLARLSEMAERMETVLSRLPVRSLTAPEGGSDDEEFSRRYLATISDSLDQLELFGLRLERFTRPQTTLSVAYVSLSVSKEDGPRVGRPEALRISDWRSEERESAAVRVEHALGDHRLILIRGEAGSGKSTLLRWLAITAARGTFSGELSALNGCVPFLIKLRSHAGGPLPRPEEYLDDAAGNLAGIMPRGWAHRRLLSGRAMLLVDGVDEITASQRQAVRQWLKGVVSQFPGVRVVVTSRPAAAAAGWLRAEGFSTAFLEQLGPPDLRALVHHWHDAVRGCADLPCPPERLPAYAAKLLARLESAPHLRTLASTPLLAAMLCALNLDLDALPRNRIGLYAAALDMLLETRDAKRDVPSALTTPLEREQKIRILQDLAWHLSTSGRVELPRPLLRFTGLRTLALFGSSQLHSLRQLPSLEAVGSLSLADSRLGRGALGPLVDTAPNVTYLYLDNCDWLDDLAPLARLELQDLSIPGSSAVSDLRPLNRQNDLRLLDASRTRVDDLTPLEGLTQLGILRLTGCGAVADLRPVAALPNLHELRIQRIAAGTDLAPLAQNQRVTVYIAARQDVRGEEALGHRLRIS